MEKIDKKELTELLVDVRRAYRLLYLYQERVLGVVDYIRGQYELELESGWSKFSNFAPRGKTVKLDKWAWDWLNMYLYEFNLGSKEKEGHQLHFALLLQSDTGFFDTPNIDRLNVEAFGSPETAATRLIFISALDTYGCPVQQLLRDKLDKNHREWVEVKEDNLKKWAAKAYSLERFLTNESTDEVIAEFDSFVKIHLGLNLK